MFEKQCKSIPSTDLVKASSSIAEDASAQSTDAVQRSSNKNDPAVPPSNPQEAGDYIAQKVGEKQKEQEREDLENPETNISSSSNTPPTKRAKLDE